MITDAQRLLRGLSADREYGSWHLLDNGAVGFSTGKAGWHPWVLVQPSNDSQPFSIAIPRSTTSFDGIDHPPHTSRHQCRISSEGRLAVMQRKPIARSVILAAALECVEPDPDGLRALIRGRRR